ncbi:hypothetical protein D5S18_26340 [Nocardia panacis]|uniref:Imidazole glycerol phosphate synthase subunit HisF n=1 Tax=Nocardia panacis TaxID=2340916 RepID=A0A3A4KD04_9NOCA|nr:HisA/HisF-related TIM barrel protein [Nocardia panacis]RJO70725.1 hypothetical protein D5S18_26340 [Nocardia panacis]
MDQYNASNATPLESPILPCVDICGTEATVPSAIPGLADPSDPIAIAAHYRAQGADKVFVDVQDSWENYRTFLPVLKKMAVGGGLWATVAGGRLPSAAAADMLFEAGVQVLGFSTTSLEHPSMVCRLADRYGSARLVGIMNIRHTAEGHWHVFVDGGTRPTDLDAIVWAQMLVDLGVGSLLPNNLDREGTGAGFDVDQVRAFADAVPIPVIASGGCGSLEHIYGALTVGGARYAIVNKVVHGARISLTDAYDYLRTGGVPAA